MMLCKVGCYTLATLTVIAHMNIIFLGTSSNTSTSWLTEQSQPLSTQSLLAWDTTQRIKFAIPFQDIKPEIYLGALLRRLCETVSHHD
jgi:hypothetical protein